MVKPNISTVVVSALLIWTGSLTAEVLRVSNSDSAPRMSTANSMHFGIAPQSRHSRTY